MKLDFGETFEEKEKRLSKWHKFFAWYPVAISAHDYRWLETVRRKGVWYRSYDTYEWDWEYRSL